MEIVNEKKVLKWSPPTYMYPLPSLCPTRTSSVVLLLVSASPLLTLSSSRDCNDATCTA